MRKALLRAGVFALGVVAFWTVFEIYRFMGSGLPIWVKLNWYTLEGLLKFGLVAVPGACLGFYLLRAYELAAANAALLGFAFGLLTAPTIYFLGAAKLGSLALALCALWFLVGAAIVAWGGGVVLRHREAHV
jgi:hypothetical protein